MRTVLMAAALAIGCGDEPAPTDGAPPQPDSSVVDSFRVPVGAACDVAQTELCDSGFGFCFESVCRKQCSSPPLCEAGEAMQFVPNTAGATTCVCVPP